MPSPDWPENVLELLSVPGLRNVYVLGSFASYVTLYSQQVRALNLIHALQHEGVIADGSNVVVVGAGAAGLTASAAAALLNANVTVLEELEGPMELQYNNRQRWLHPYVYDWPIMDWEKDDSTHLPILNWTAAYADRVAEQIESDWLRIVKETGRITAVWRAKEVEIQAYRNSISVHWNSPDPISDAVVILAAGFGLEHDNDWTWSYWTEDEIDGDFRRPEQRPKWLVSGFGDGALTDVMRLCIRRFRHHKILDLLRDAKDIDTVKLDLEDLQKFSGPGNAEWVHNRFLKLQTGDLGDKLRPTLRQEGPEVHLTGRSPWIYAPGASVLNRLIVRLLEKANAFRYVAGKPERVRDGKVVEAGGTGSIRRVDDGFRVELARGERFYNHVICRHGPSPPPRPHIQEKFRPVYEACSDLIKRWSNLAPGDDPTRQLKWLKGFLPEPVTKPTRDRRRAYSEMAVHLGLHAKSLAVYKDLRRDGSSTLNWQIDQLVVEEVAVNGLWCQFELTTGVIGAPALNASAQQLGITWIPRNPVPLPDSDNLQRVIGALRERGRYISGELRFGKPLRKGDAAVSFGFSVEVLNGDALSTWEFEELYPDVATRLHCNYSPLNNLEYFARTVWFPLESLRLQLKLPAQVTSTPRYSRFECASRNDITRGEIAPNFTLYLDPGLDSQLSPKFVTWKLIESTADAGDPILTRTGENAWDLLIEYPPVGNIYSIDFELASTSWEMTSDARQLAELARDFRKQLVDYGRLRSAGRQDPRVAAFGGLLRTLYAEIEGLGLGPLENEQYQITFMAYDDEGHRLVMIDGLVSHGEVTPDMWNFWLPFGIGLGGACFKQADRVFVHLRSSEEPGAGPDVYLNVPGRSTNEVLVSVPLNHPDYDPAIEIERSRQCIGVVNIGSEDPGTKLRSITADQDRLNEVWRACQRFCRAIAELFEAGGDKLNAID